MLKIQKGLHCIIFLTITCIFISLFWYILKQLSLSRSVARLDIYIRHYSSPLWEIVVNDDGSDDFGGGGDCGVDVCGDDYGDDDCGDDDCGDDDGGDEIGRAHV